MSQPNNLLTFRAAIANSFQDVAKCMSLEEFSTAFTMLESRPSLVKKLHSAMEEVLFETMTQDLKLLETDECLTNGMTTLAKLAEETTVPTNVKLWRPPGDVNLHLRSLDAEKMENECKTLETYIDNLKKENAELLKIVTKKRKNVQAIHDHIKQLLGMPLRLSELENTVKFNQKCVEKLYDNTVP